MSSLAPKVLLALALSAALACRANDVPSVHPAAALAAPVIADVPDLHELDGVYTAAQPTPNGFAALRAAGIETVVDLRHDRERPDYDERSLVQGLGMRYVQLPWNGPEELTDEVFDEGRRLLIETERPFLMHCGSANRVGALWLAWRALDGGLAVDEAAAEARVVGLSTPAYEEAARDYVQRRR